MIKCFVFLFSCIMPYAVEAGEILNIQDGFQLAKAVKLGREKASSAAANASLFTGAGSMGAATVAIDCDANCSKCDTSTGKCSECKTGRYLSDNLCLLCSNISVPYGTCAACSSGTSCSKVECSSGYYLTGTNTCGKCPAGTYVEGGKCVDCPKGTYSKGENQSSCNPCPAGTYSSGENQSSCRPCSDISVPNGKCTACSSSGSCSKVECSSGYYLIGTNTCVACPAGTYVEGGKCVACPQQTYSSGENWSSCRRCEKIYVPNGKCIDCSSSGSCSQYIPHGEAAPVWMYGKCPAGTYAYQHRLQAHSYGVCSRCPEGTYSSYENQSSCRPCSNIKWREFIVGDDDPYRSYSCTKCSSTGSCYSSRRL